MHYPAIAALMLGVLTSAMGAPDPFPPFPKSKVAPAAFAKKQPRIDPEYPGAAYKAGIGQGEATVGVMIMSDGKPTDFFVISCSHPAFGEALLDELKSASYQPQRIGRVPVPGRYVHRYKFLPDTQMNLNVLQAPRAGGNFRQKLSLEPRREEDLDAALELVEAGLPRVPPGYVSENDAPVRALVTFYVDTEGRVRLPEVVSAPAPELIPNAVKAILTWKFQPPLADGEPATVYTARPLTFAPRE